MRLFAAVLPDPEFKRALLHMQGRITGFARSVRPTAPQNLHLTLAFIGETSRPGDAEKALSHIRFEPFELLISGTGRFGNLWWAGVDGGEQLKALAAAAARELAAAGFLLDDKPFKSHITLARDANLPHGFRLEPVFAKQQVSEFSLMKSERINGKLEYTELSRFKNRRV